MVNPQSPLPMVGASGAISGVLGAYLVFYPRVRLHLLVFLFIIVDVISVPAWLMLLYWFGLQVLSGLPQLTSMRPDVSAFFAHIGGFAAGVILKLFARKELLERARSLRTGRWAHSR